VVQKNFLHLKLGYVGMLFLVDTCKFCGKIYPYHKIDFITNLL